MRSGTFFSRNHPQLQQLSCLEKMPGNRDYHSGRWESDSESPSHGHGILVPRMFFPIMVPCSDVRIWSYHIQISALVEAIGMDMPKTMRIFAHYIYACVRNPNPGHILDRKDRVGYVLRRRNNRWGNMIYMYKES